MGLGNFIKNLFGFWQKLGLKNTTEVIYETEEPIEEFIEEIHNLWDSLVFKENTQAFHLAHVVGFDEWVDMPEIRRRILELFGIDYKNERSLYPYIKTLVDIGLMETTNVGGRRKWRKKDLLIKLKRKKQEREEELENVKAVS